jgi:hypothetical protein
MGLEDHQGESENVIVLHTDINPMTGACNACGASREMISDAFPCDRIDGPHKVAIIAAMRELRSRVRYLSQLRHDLEQGERAIVSLSQQIREEDAVVRELAVSIEKLKNG